MRIGLAQMNPVIGDFSGNVKKICSFAMDAYRQQADLVIFPELALCGYPPMDLLEHPSFVQENLRALRTLQHELPPALGVVVGYVEKNKSAAGKPLHNTAALIHQRRILLRQHKTLLPTYDVFDEARYFEPASERIVVPFKQRRLGIAICEDMWGETEPQPGLRYPIDPIQDLLDQGAEIILIPSASPYYMEKVLLRAKIMELIGKGSGVPLVYVNMVGANDSLIFDGQSLVTDREGRLVFRAPAFEEGLFLIDTDALPAPLPPLEVTRLEEVREALHLGIRDYLTKTGFDRVHLGLSGGIDSALVATLAVEALGPERVSAFLMPSQFSSEGSVHDATALAGNLGIQAHTLPIRAVFDTFLSTLEPVFQGLPWDITEENIQARIRGTLLMAYSNKMRSLVLTTGNKSELAVGYCTIYGDTAGALAVIGDLFKTQVYALARHIREDTGVIPEEILTKPPSAELRPNQTDQDSLPPYEVLDQILELYLLRNLTAEDIIASGFDPDLVRHVLLMVVRAEHKRRQTPPVLKISPRAFGTGRRIPIARAPYEPYS